MQLKIIVLEAEEGGFWGEVPALPGCVSQGETMDEFLANIREAIEGCLEVDIDSLDLSADARILFSVRATRH